jgi:hypothetical protein
MRSGENTPAWYLVDHGRRIVSGPFLERASTGALDRYQDETTLPEDENALRAAYGVWADDGTIELRPAPADRAWEAYLSAQLDRVAGHGEQPLPELAVEVATALVEVGFDLHDCAGTVGDKALGGVCLTPVGDDAASGPGIAVAWTQHDRVVTDHVHPADAEEAVQTTMDTALAGVLTALGFEVVEYGTEHAVLVSGRRPR